MTTKDEATTARKIAKAHNARIRQGFAGNGKLVFGPDGSGGEWYSDGSYGFTGKLVFPMRWQRVTAADVEEFLGNQ